MSTRWTPDEDDVILRTPNLTAAEVARKLGRSTQAVVHRRSLLGRRHGLTFQPGPKGPWVVGKRRLLARSCSKCGLLLEAARFGLSNQGRWRVICVHCRAVDEQLRAKPYEPNEVDQARARANIQKLQAITLPSATSHRQPWTEKDHEVLADPDLTGLEKALRLGRTYMAVSSQCRDHGYRSRHGQGDPVKGQWVIDNPNESAA